MAPLISFNIGHNIIVLVLQWIVNNSLIYELLHRLLARLRFMATLLLFALLTDQPLSALADFLLTADFPAIDSGAMPLGFKFKVYIDVDISSLMFFPLTNHSIQIMYNKYIEQISSSSNYNIPPSPQCSPLDSSYDSFLHSSPKFYIQ
jgi:hypothetical protein